MSIKRDQYGPDGYRQTPPWEAPLPTDIRPEDPKRVIAGLTAKTTNEALRKDLANALEQHMASMRAVVWPVLQTAVRTIVHGADILDREARENPNPEHGRSAGVLFDGLATELEKLTASLFRRRRGRVVEGDRAWCAECGRVVVDGATGADVCLSCLPMVVAGKGGG